MTPRQNLFSAALMSVLAVGGAGTARAAGDAANGATVFKKCAACHSAEQGVNKVGPSLFGVVGRPAGSISGYSYSPAVQQAAAKGLVWSEETIVAYLANPHKYLGDFVGDPSVSNKMPFSLADEQQRRDVVAYLKSLAPQ
ncbi:c-type cytochrome [Nitrospirillum sp. BR 11164]|uniref:c-type cytochrome n=1 Tax=Nitrospirillum sp. BR 11164 TaxID=3104324 RepID=UPI002AFF1FF2|nr:c-type cytochrome [Nitrospirillum sp. BR 11164]MEA1648157.1 c-type cytochrome [Nitrospirillum sp. BR 11164]